jgi:hypothetical protein
MQSGMGNGAFGNFYLNGYAIDLSLRFRIEKIATAQDALCWRRSPARRSLMEFLEVSGMVEQLLL